MKKPLIATSIVALIALIIWASVHDRKPRGTTVEVQAAERRSVSSRVKATGEITPEKKVEISAKVVGEIISLPVVEGQKVSDGQLLVEIERDLYEGARDQARAALRQTEVASQRLEVQLADARRNLRRVGQLHDDQLVSQEALDQAQLAVDMAEVEIRAQEHAIDQYRSALKRATDDLARTTIRSPMDGVLIQLNAEQGETVVPGSTNLPGSVIMIVADMSTLLAEVEVSEVDVVSVELGQPAEVTVDALRADEPQPGHVVEIATSGRRDPTQGTIRFRVKVALDDPDPSLRPAMTAKVDILTATSENALTVPVQAVVKRVVDADGEELRGSAAKGQNETDIVYIVTEGETTIRSVVTGVSDVLHVEIIEGLTEDEEVVIGPYRTLKKLKAGEDVRTEEKKTDDDDAEDEESEGVEVRID
jgi:HlyD family secretion protein